jgi:hypothetical protein
MTTTLLEPPTVLAGGKPPNRFQEQLIAPPADSDIADGDNDAGADADQDLEGNLDEDGDGEED